MIVVRQAARKSSTSNSPSAPTNFIRLRLARLQAVSSRNMYSLHGLLALMRAVFGQVCQSLMVVSYWMPGSPHCQAASAICASGRGRGSVSHGSPEST